MGDRLADRLTIKHAHLCGHVISACFLSSSFKGVLTVATMTFVEEKSIKYGVDKVYLM